MWEQESRVCGVVDSPLGRGDVCGLGLGEASGQGATKLGPGAPGLPVSFRGPRRFLW